MSKYKYKQSVSRTFTIQSHEVIEFAFLLALENCKFS